MFQYDQGTIIISLEFVSMRVLLDSVIAKKSFYLQGQNFLNILRVKISEKQSILST